MGAGSDLPGVEFCEYSPSLVSQSTGGESESVCGRKPWEDVERRKYLQLGGARGNRARLGEKSRGSALGLRALDSWAKKFWWQSDHIPAYLAASLTTQCSLFHPDHDEDLGHLPADYPPGLW